jgi:hypothetical protein
MTVTGIKKLCKQSLPWIIIAMGIVLRFRQYISDRSLWLDEAHLARNIVERSFTGLLQPLSYDQNAPIGFMLLSKLATMIGGPTSLALRFFPLVFGIIALFLFYRIARHFLRPSGTIIALTFFSFATPMVYYSAEFKQYMGDVLATLILWYFFLVAPPKNRIWLVVLGAVVVWFSHASIFILAALGVADVSLWKYAVPYWIASFSLNYLFFLRYSLSEVIINNWKGHFLVFPWLQGEQSDIFSQSIRRMLGFFVNTDTVFGHSVVLLLGYGKFIKTHAKQSMVFILPIVFLFIASGFQKYPFVPRLFLFLAPSLYLAIGAGVDVLVAWGGDVGHRVGKFIILISILPLLLWGIVPSTIQEFTHEIKVEELHQVLTYLHKNYEAGDTIYLYYAAESPFSFYAPKFGLDKVPVIIGISSREDVMKYQEDLQKLKGKPRVWVVFSHIYKRGVFGEDRYITAYLDAIGKRLDYYPQVGASLYLYDLR